jgi:AraC-like DNA-binding protein
MKYEIIEPPKALEKFIRYFSILDYNNTSVASNQIKVFADRYPHLVFQHDNGRSAFHVNGNPLPTTFISGIKTKPYTLDINPTHTVTTVTFYPSAIKALFGVEVIELNNELPEIQHFAPAHLNELLLNTASHAERIKIMVDFFSKRLSKSKHDLFAFDNAKLFHAINSETTLPSLQQHLNISERQLERKFKSSMGMSPKQYLRTTRFERALSLIRSNSFVNLSDIAYALNFTDQSHFIKDFKEFSGFTPKVFLNQRKALEESTTRLTPGDELITINHLITS